MEIEIYKNYGCLAAEKRAVYTYNCPAGTAVCWDKMTVRTPKDWEESENEYKRPIFRPKGQEYWWEVNDLLHGSENPMFLYYGKDGFTAAILEVINEK